MNWIEFIQHTPTKLMVPKFKGGAGAIMGFRRRALGHSTTLRQMVRPA